MAAYCGTIGSVNVLEFVSTDLFDESQENPFLLQKRHVPTSSTNTSTAKLNASPVRKHASVRFAELPLDDQGDRPREAPSPITKMSTATWSTPGSPANVKRQSTVVVPTPAGHHHAAPTANYAPQQQPLPPPGSAVSFSPQPTSPQATHPSITITLPFGMGRSSTNESDPSTATTQADKTDLHTLLYSLSQLGLGQLPASPQPPARTPMNSPYQQPPSQYHHQQFRDSFASTVSTPTSPSNLSSSSLSPRSQHSQLPQQPQQPPGTASLMFRALPSRQSRRMTKRQSNAARQFSSAPNSPHRDVSLHGFFPADDDAPEDHVHEGSQPSSPQRSRGSVTFLTVKNLLRGGGALARTVRHEQPNRRPTCMGTELTISSRLKRREKFQRPTVITDAYHRVSAMRLGTSPMKVKIKHRAFPETWQPSGHENEDAPNDLDFGMPSPKGQLHRESLITLETLDKIGTRHACPVQLIEEPLPDFSSIQPRVDAWNNYQKPQKNLRRPSAWLLGATATSTPPGLHG